MNAIARCGALLLAVALSACATLGPAERDAVARQVVQARPTAVDCDRPDACAQPSPLRELAGRAFAESTPTAPRHYALILDRGSDALLARVNLIRSATTAIDLQTYIFDEDDAGRLVLDELLAAARRGVRVRLLIDQLAALRRVETLAALAGVHSNLQVRLYNPVLGRARINYPSYVVAAACCWRRLNQRMHSKLLLVDAAVGISGGRNYQDDYYDWDAAYNFRDRDVLVAGPEACAMRVAFDRFWNDRRSVPVEQLADVAQRLREGVPALAPATFERPERAARMQADAGDAELVRERLAARAIPVHAVHYISDLPDKHHDENDVGGHAEASRTLRELIEGAKAEVLLQTPYLVLSRPARRMFRDLRRRPDPPRVIVSTNSLASTDAFIAYALSYKYKRRYLRDYGFNIYEYKPFPQDAPIDVASTGAEVPVAPRALPPRPRRPLGTGSAADRARYQYLSREYAALRYASRRANQPVPLRRAGVRMGMHAKSLVVDRRIGVVGTHNFDPRGDRYNTESAVVIDDPAFARALADSIRRDTRPANSWVIARRDKPPVLSGLNYSVGKSLEQLPVFDIWPWRYATSYEFVPGPDCPQPLPPDAPGFRACYLPVGDFPEVSLGLKGLTTRLFTAFGAGLAPIL